MSTQLVSAARKASFSAGVPTVTRTPSPAKPRTRTPSRSQAAVAAAACPPSGSQTKLAWLSGTSGSSLRTSAVSRSRSPVTMATRRSISASAASAASAAAWAADEVENGVITLRTAAATAGAATR